MKYIKPILRALWKPMLGSLGIAAAVALCVFWSHRETMAVWKPLCVAAIAWLILWILLTVMIAGTMKKEEPLDEILAEHGYGGEWLQKHSEIYPDPDREQKLRRVDVLSFMGRYDEAKALLNSISTVGMSDDRNFEYNNAWLDMLLTTGHYAEAQAFLTKCRQFMDIYANANPLRGIAYGCNACVILALADDFEGSEHYYNAALHTVETTKGISKAMVRIAKTMQLYALGFFPQAEAQEEQTYQEIISEPLFTKQWQKGHFLAQLGRAQQLAPEKRQEGQPE